MKTKTLCVQQFHTTDGDDIVTPIHTSVIFAMDSPSSSEGFQYGRIGNATRQSLELVLMKIHGASHGIAVCSGASAIFTACLLTKSGGVILHHNELYEGTRRIFDSVLSPLGIRAIACDFHNLDAVRNDCAINAPQIIWIETPTNPMLRVLDMEKIAEIAHQQNAIVIVDTTMCSSLIQRPLAHGADIVVESLTKILNGHSDALGGFIGTNNKSLGERMRFLAQTTGPVLGPWESSLILRGIKTAPIRIGAQQQHATHVAKSLLHNSHIKNVFIPGSQNLLEHSIVKKQMRGKGIIVCFQLTSEIDPINFVSRLHLIRISHSFGGVESTIQHPCTMMDQTGVPDLFRPDTRLFRLSVGLEDPNDIIEDLKQALEESASHVI